jgi:hypothetical protein
MGRRADSPTPFVTPAPSPDHSSCHQTAQRTVKRVDEVDPEEMERRAAHLRRQRDLLLMKKKKEQEERLRIFNEASQCGVARGVAELHSTRSLCS